MTEEKKFEVPVDFEGKPPEESQNKFPKTLIPEDTYDLKVIDIEAKEMPTFPDKKKPNQPLTEQKLIFTLQIIDNSAGKENFEKELVHFQRPVICPEVVSGNKVYSASKLYEMFVNLGIRDKAKEQKEKLKDLNELVGFLKKEMLGQLVRSSVKTITSKKLDEAGKPIRYSSVVKILRFAQNVEVSKNEVK